jgi:sugar phosphate isomerase/epimerase
VESAIGFAEWIVDDDARRAKGLEQARRDMDLVQQIGGTRIAAPAAGAADVSNIDYVQAADRYRALLVLGDHVGVIPQVEVWGFSKTLTRLGQAVLVAIESGHPQACVLADVYHLYKGGSDFTGLKLLNGTSMHVFHVNDYPAEPARDVITDAHRVYPGDGIAPLHDVIRTLREISFDGAMSIELFNPTYWKQDPLEVARTALHKLQAAVAQAS